MPCGRASKKRLIPGRLASTDLEQPRAEAMTYQVPVGFSAAFTTKHEFSLSISQRLPPKMGLMFFFFLFESFLPVGLIFTCMRDFPSFFFFFFCAVRALVVAARHPQAAYFRAAMYTYWASLRSVVSPPELLRPVWLVDPYRCRW